MVGWGVRLVIIYLDWVVWKGKRPYTHTHTHTGLVRLGCWITKIWKKMCWSGTKLSERGESFDDWLCGVC